MLEIKPADEYANWHGMEENELNPSGTETKIFHAK